MIKKALLVGAFVGFVGCSGGDEAQEATTPDGDNPASVATNEGVNKAADTAKVGTTPTDTAPSMAASMAQAANQAKIQASQQWVVNVSALNVRNAPSIKGKVLRTLKQGQTVSKMGESGFWVKISETPTEYVSSKYLKQAP